MQQPFASLETEILQLSNEISPNLESARSQSSNGIRGNEMLSESDHTTPVYQSEVPQNNTAVLVHQSVQFIEHYPLKARCIRARVEGDGMHIAKPALTVYAAFTSESWNPYLPFQSAEEWQTVVLAVKQRLRKTEIDKWIKRQLWQVNTFQSANHLWNLIDSLPDALGACSWTRQDLVVEKTKGQSIVHSLIEIL